MPKNVLFSLKNCKNRQTLGEGSAPRPPLLPHQSSYIVNSSLCICPLSTDSFGIN